MLSFVAFLGIVAWAYSRDAASAFDEAAQRAVRAARRRRRRRREPSARSVGHERFHIGLLELSTSSSSRSSRSLALRRAAVRHGPHARGEAPPTPGEPAGHDRPRLGRRPRRVQQSAAALVDVAVLDHDRVRARSTSSLYPGPRQASRACSAGRRPARTRREVDGVRREGRRRSTPSTWRWTSKQVAADPQARGDGRAAVPQQLRAVPRLGRRRRPRASRTCATTTGSTAATPETIATIDHQRPHGRDAGVGPGARRRTA